MERDQTEFLLNAIATSLQRIADSLNRIANDPKAMRIDDVMDKPFPFSFLSFRVRNPENWTSGRPETFRQMIEIGRSAIVGGEKTKRIGACAVAEIDQVFEDHGLSFEWNGS